MLVEAQGISKRFVAVQALRDVDIGVERGEIHALVGENGAGKSTLGKVISGIVRPDAGELRVARRTVHYGSPRDALLDGITTITQEISLLGKQTVLENVMLGQEIAQAGVLRRRAMLDRYRELQSLTGFDLEPDERVGRLRLADQKRVEVMQAIARDARLIIMDEPTAMLADDESEDFLAIVRQLRADGRTIVYVSHFLEEVLGIADRVTVMRNGEVVRTSATRDETPASLVEAMLGQSVATMYPARKPPPGNAPPVFEVTDLRSEVFDGIDLTVRAGEIVGLAGLVGSGRSRLARTLFGAEPVHGGSVRVAGREVRLRSPGDAIRAGIYLLPESRKEQGLLLKQSVRDNITMPHLQRVAGGAGIIPERREQRQVASLIAELNVQPALPRNRVDTLSGGNQQKALFAKWLFERPTVFLVDEPTRGIDVGAKQAIYRLIVDLAAEGIAILLISSELEELLGLAHRVLVMRLGRIVARFGDAGEELDESAVMRAAFGTDPQAEAGTES